MRERLFLPYFSTKQRGTGLGLAIAAKIIQEHQGTIRAEKNEPAGAKFIVELRPAASFDSEAEAPATSFASSQNGYHPDAGSTETQPASAPEDHLASAIARGQE
jgi:hypothetical protein